jgi:alpha-amylase
VGPDGILRGLKPGTARIGAAVGGGLAWMEVRVTPVSVQGVRLDPGGLVLRVGESATVRATVQTVRGGRVTGVPVEWQSSDPSVAGVTPDGLVSGVRFGIARIAATAGGRRATISVEVRATSSVSLPRVPLGPT